MFRAFYVALVVVLMFAFGATSALAAPRAPEADTFVDHQTANQGTNFDTQDLRLSGSNQGSVCTATRTGLIRWDLADVGASIGSAKLTLTTIFPTGSTSAGGYEITLFRVADDAWDEATVTYLSGIAVGPAIQSVNLPNPVTDGFPIVFDNAALASYLDEQAAGDGKASFAVRFTTCASTSTQRFADKEPTGSVGAPILELFGTNAVTLTDASAQQTNSLPLYVGLGALALVAVAGVGMSRRRTAAR